MTVGGRSVVVTAARYRVLDALARRPERVVTPAELADDLWGEAWRGDLRFLGQHVCWLRAMLERHGGDAPTVVTVRRHGYMLTTGGEKLLKAVEAAKGGSAAVVAVGTSGSDSWADRAG